MARSVMYYGIHLGDPHRWRFTAPAPRWLRDGVEIVPEDDVDDNSFACQAEARLAELADQAAPVPDSKAFVRRRYGVEFGTYGAPAGLSAFVATYVLRHEWDLDPIALDAAWMARAPQDGQWDELLQAALHALGITPEQASPTWSMCTRLGD
ncbi:hypothetical protein AB0F17_34210 [Nonomuraea sp. NPDC026600]|uniref:hypothetical protein n=1 Tax=Nonomuraea sp. NPDC026600 TaxID=3155363 RepID=UPI0033CBFEAB